jgi:CheY-like chemotaxis protein
MKPRSLSLNPEAYLIIVEDDQDDRALLMDVFVSLNWAHHVKILQNSDELLDLLENTPHPSLFPTLILLDYNMPALSGEATLLILKKEERYQHIPVCIFSTVMDHRREKLLKVLGAYNCRQKPSTVEGLRELMEDYKKLALQFNHSHVPQAMAL